ncbi:hypothetical protein H0E87_011283 [Populus deltoides]|uniref:Uncharacterized protein n=1 Tax=Populus deltoides TaxID=3696 RepID=A0A8T2YWJ5_POPDE|nr:hypothetical protein H0E87_011283 [Populus deltoides]
MGSLMAGWDSPVPDPRSMKYRRNRSLTRGEIDAYWRLKKRTEEDHLKAISGLSSNSQDGADEDHGIEFQRSSSLPAATTKERFMDMETDQASLEQLIKKNGWWTSSNWAFLNEPPVLERSSNNRTPHFHVASLATSKSNTGINAQ